MDKQSIQFYEGAKTNIHFPLLQGGGFTQLMFYFEIMRHKIHFYCETLGQMKAASWGKSILKGRTEFFVKQFGGSI